MTNDDLVELRHRVNSAEAIKRQIEQLRGLAQRIDDVKIWGVCFYFDDECEDRLYADMPTEDVYGFVNDFVIKKVDLLEKEFAAL